MISNAIHNILSYYASPKPTRILMSALIAGLLTGVLVIITYAAEDAVSPPRMGPLAEKNPQTRNIFAKILSSSPYSSPQKVSAKGVTNIGPAGTDFINSFGATDAKPIVVTNIKRSPLTGVGINILLNNDNIQVFEYADPKTASAEATTIVTSYSHYSKKNPWVKLVNIYVKDKLLVFYMGNNKNILKKLDAAFGMPVLGRNLNSK